MHIDQTKWPGYSGSFFYIARLIDNYLLLLIPNTPKEKVRDTNTSW
jgi:hypothetical protein